MTDGGFAEDDAFRPLVNWDGEALMRLFRERLLTRLVEKHAVSQELATKLLSWKHPGFSAHVGEPIAPENAQAIEDMAGYVTRNPLSLRRLVYIDGRQAVIYKALKPNPTLGRNFQSLDALEWLARMSDHIPDPGKHRTLFYAHYANRIRGHRAAEGPNGALEEKPPKKRRCSASCARLISKVYNVDPLTCRKCGGELTLVVYLHDKVAIKQILDHLGLSQPEDERPPPPDIRYVPVDEKGREAEAP